MLEAEESLRSLAAALGKRLIKDGYDQRASRDFEQTHQEHRKRRQRKRSAVRLYVSKESLKIAHQQFGNTLNEGSRVVQWKDWKTVENPKENYTYRPTIASRMSSLNDCRFAIADFRFVFGPKAIGNRQLQIGDR
jgi:hypothetical protein